MAVTHDISDDIIVNADAATTEDKMAFGGKGASLFWMASLGLPVPPFFVLTTRAWREWRARGQLSDQHVDQVMDMIGWLERRTGRTFGAGPAPLLVSVRSTGPVSMPSMMDTILNLGLTPDSVGALCREFGDLRMIADIITNFADTGTPVFAHGHSGAGTRRAPLPNSAREQLIGAIEGVLASWNNERAQLYRRMNRIPDDYGTAVVVQAMVYGNADDRSGTGVLFTRDPVTGQRRPCGEWMASTQGEAIVSGRATPSSLDELAATQPEIHRELLEFGKTLERAAAAPQDIEFTVERGQLFLLQTRALKSAPLATCATVLDLLDEGLITEQEAVRRLSFLDLSELRTDALADPAAAGQALAAGLGASPGITGGVVAREIDVKADDGRPIVLVRPETAPRDLPAMRRASALVTENGGMTSHAAIVARELKKPCVVGCGPLDGLPDGAEITVDGGAGVVYRGRLPVEHRVPEVIERALSLKGMP